MSETQAETPNKTDPQTSNINSSLSFVDQIKTKINATLSTWKFKLGLVILGIFGIGLLIFFWPHLVAVQGMNGWSASSGAKPISCMIKDTNDDGYVSCSALLEEEVVPLECGASLFNIGCRINYGAAAPSIRVKPRIKL